MDFPFRLGGQTSFWQIYIVTGVKKIPAVLLALAGICLLAGCNTPGGDTGTSSGGNATVKERGVYTTLAMPGENLDMPGSGYVSRNTFGLGQTPAAVVVGYGFWDGNNNQPQPFDLELDEAATGAVVFKASGDAYLDKAAIFNLPIRKSGDYHLKLIMSGSVADTWDFSVTRNVPADIPSATGQPPVYAQGNFSASIEPVQTTDVFMDYDDTLMQYLLNSVQRELVGASHDDFAQVPPGQVVIQFDLSETGQVSSPQIVQNTLTDALGQFFLHALQAGAPYPAWPAAIRAAFGSDTRVMKVMFNYQ